MSTEELIALFNNSTSSRMELVKAGELLYQQPLSLTETVILILWFHIGSQLDSSAINSQSLSWFVSTSCNSVLERKQIDPSESHQNTSSSFRRFTGSWVFYPNLQFDCSASSWSGWRVIRYSHSLPLQYLWTWWRNAVLFAMQSEQQTLSIHRSRDALRFLLFHPLTSRFVWNRLFWGMRFFLRCFLSRTRLGARFWRSRSADKRVLL